MTDMTKHGMPMSFAEPLEDGTKLMEDLISYYREYVRTGEDEYIVLVTYVLFCHAFFAFTRTPYINVTSPTPDCGKTQLLEVTALVMPNPMMASSCTAAVLARSIDLDHPILMVDEFDQLQAGDKDLLAAILATINSGYKKSGCRYILEPVKGGGWQCKKMSTFCPKILSGISSLPATTKTRCIPIHMERLAPSDHVSDPDEYIIEPQAAKLKHRAAKWSKQHIDKLAMARPDSPRSLHNRQREIARPLFAIADAVGGKWPEMVRAAVTRLFARVNAAPADNIKVQLLESIREAFGDEDKIASEDLVEALVAMEDKPWANWNKGKGITKNQVAGQLKDFHNASGDAIAPKQLWFPDTKKNNRGYAKADFKDCWVRYLPPPFGVLDPLHPPFRALDPLESNKDAGKTQFCEVLEAPSLAPSKSEESSITTRVLAPLAVEKPERGVNGAKADGREYVFGKTPVVPEDPYEAEERAAIQELN